MSDDDIIEKVGKLTTTWNSEVSPDHCLHHFGSLTGTSLGVGGHYLSGGEANFTTGHRSERLIEIQSQVGHFGAPQLSGQEKDSDSLSSLELMDLASEIYREYARVLEDRGEEKHRYLLEVECSLQDRASRLAQTIDDRFRTTDPDGKSNLVVDACRQTDLISEAKDQHGSEAELKSILDAEPIPQNWSISVDLLEEDVDGQRVSGRYPHVHDGISTGRRRPCVKAEEFVEGYSCEFEYFPADVPLERLEAVSQAYVAELEEEATEMACTFRLLEVRLRLLREVLQQYELYGKLTGISESELGNIIDGEKNCPGANPMGRSPKMSEGEDPEEREEVVLDLLCEKEYWHLKGPHRGKPKWGDISLEVANRKPDLFTGNPEQYEHDSIPITGERIAELVRDEWGVDLSAIRKELDVPNSH